MIKDEPKYRPIEEGKPNLTFAMIKENLAVPIPRELIRQRPQGRDEVDYVNITDLKDLLDIRAGIWTVEIRAAEQIGNQFCTIVRINIHAFDGIFPCDGNGTDAINVDTWGDSYSNSYAQGFRRACESLGLGRELWRKEENDYANQPRTQSQQSQGQKPAQQALPQQELSGQRPAGEPASQKQLNYIASLCVEKGLDEVKLAQEKFQTKFEDLTKTMASDLIKYVSNYKK